MINQETVRAQLQRNLTSIRERIEVAAAKSGRTGADITLVAVTKYVDVAMTQALVDCGQSVLGESRPQVLWEKAETIVDDSVEWHLIGHLQRNKAKRTTPYCSLIHSVDSLRLLGTLDSIGQELGHPVRCLLEINVSGEDAKHGFEQDELESVLTKSAELKGVRINGLMTMASLSGGSEQNRREFATLCKLKETHSNFLSDNVWLNDLSMGMSGDFEVAIEEGATIVRIGSVLFDGVRS